MHAIDDRGTGPPARGELRAKATARSSTVASYSDRCLTTCEVMPVYPGGEAAIDAFMRELQYPKEAREEWIEGKVWVTFVLEKDGSVSKCAWSVSVHPLLDAEAVRVVSSMETGPGSPICGNLCGCV